MLGDLVKDSRPGSISRNIKSIIYPKLRRFLLQTVNNETLLEAFMSSRLSLGEPVQHQDLHNALKVAAWHAIAPDSLMKILDEPSPLLNLDLLLGKGFVWAENTQVPFLEPFGPARIVDAFTEDVFKKSLEEEWQPVVRFVLSATVATKQTDFPLHFSGDEKKYSYKLYLVNEEIIRGKDDVFYRVSNEDYAPILGKDMGEDAHSLVYLLQRPVEAVQGKKGGRSVNPIFLVISALFFGAALAILLLMK